MVHCFGLRRLPVSSDVHDQSKSGHCLVNDAARLDHVLAVCEDESPIIYVQEVALFEQLSLRLPALS